MKKKLMNYVAGRMVIALFFCCTMTTVVSAQTAEPESKMDRYLRLSKEADENPNNWQVQLEVGHMLLDKENSFYNQSRAAKYYERIYQQVAGINKEVPDSVFLESLAMLMTVASDKKDIKKVLFYIDELMRADQIGMDVRKEYLMTYGGIGILYNLMNGDALKALWNLQNVRKLATAEKIPGIEYTDATAVFMYEKLFSEYRKAFGDKLVEVTFYGKKYVIIAMNDWNVEMQLMGWLGGLSNDSDDKETNGLRLLYGEDGKVYDDVHGEMSYSFYYNKDGFVPQEGYNMRLITVTPEQRQKMVDAYQSYMKKNKKNKKNK